MKTVSIDEIFSEGSGSSSNLSLLGLLILVTFATRIWGDLFYKIIAKVLGGKRTFEQLLFLGVLMILLIFVYIRVYEIDS